MLQILISQMTSMSSEEHIKPTQSSAFDPESQSCSQGRDEGKPNPFTSVAATYL